MEEKLSQLKAKIETDQNFTEKLFSLETPEEVQNLLKAEGINFTLEEINEIRKALVKTTEKGELNDEDLEEVAGGIDAATVIVGAWIVGTGAKVTHDLTRGSW